MIAWVAAALAQEPEPAREPFEIVVWGRFAVDKARDDIVRAMEALGWSVRRREADRVVFSPPHAWMGRAELLDDGTFAFGRPALGFAPFPAEVLEAEQRDPPDLHAPEPASGGVTFWVLPSDRKLAPGREQVLRETRDEVDLYVAILRRTAFEETLQALPDRLDALWTQGTPLEAGPILATPDERRRAVLAYWASRAESWEGGRVAAAVGVWLAETVQTSDHPVTPAEREEFRRDDGHVLPD